MSGEIEVYVCECGNAITAATIARAVRSPHFAIFDPTIRCNDADQHGHDPTLWPEMRREIFDLAASKTRSPAP